MSLERQIEYQRRKLAHWNDMIAVDLLLRQVQYAAWPWWRKAIWKVFGR